MGWRRTGDPLARPAEKVALEVQRKLVTIGGALAGYGVVLYSDLTVAQESQYARRAQPRERVYV